ncbi:hypothetical protein [Hymenobacter sp. IS2118]|uniref:hypothetical protein n=1 Tax=Hymenobacter sp. IS2118 TaxID=1505605 RepID=UPI0012687803|nr:hypothetical protein [Hymenobacter sp. IS2118]
MKTTAIKCVSIFCILFSLASCSDVEKKLSGGYFLRMEGKDLNDILSNSAGRKEIPSNVLTCNYDNNFIIASQKPGKTDDPLYEPAVYKSGRNTIYYWLIVHSKKITLGPLSNHEFLSARQAYNVPADLVLEPLDWE